MHITDIHSGVPYVSPTGGFSAQNQVSQPLPFRIEPSVGFPPVAAVTSANTRSDKGLSQYQVSPGNLRGLKPDRNGIYTRIGLDQSRSYFARVGSGVYQVGGFDKQNHSWKVLDPRSGKAVARLEQEDGEWVPAQRSPRSVRQPVSSQGREPQSGQYAVQQRGGGGQTSQPGKPRPQQGQGGGGGTSGVQTPQPEQNSSVYRGRIEKAVDGAIGWIRGAMAKLHQPWSRALTEEMYKLFGKEALTEEGKARIEQKLGQTLQFLEQSKSSGEGNLHSGGVDPQHPDAPAFANPSTGDIYFKDSTLRMAQDRDLVEMMVHEATHAGAQTEDNWYLYPNEERHANWDGQEKPFNFDNAVNTADSMAHAVRALSEYT